MSSVPRAQGSWQTLGRSQALTCFERPVGRSSSTFFEQAHDRGCSSGHRTDSPPWPHADCCPHRSLKVSSHTPGRLHLLVPCVVSLTQHAVIWRQQPLSSDLSSARLPGSGITKSRGLSTEGRTPPRAARFCPGPAGLPAGSQQHWRPPGAQQGPTPHPQ